MGVLNGLLRCRARRETTCARAVENDGGGAGQGDGTETSGDTAGSWAATRDVGRVREEDDVPVARADEGPEEEEGRRAEDEEEEGGGEDVECEGLLP